MRDVIAFVLLLIVLSAVVWTGWRRFGSRYEWTFDGVHHVLTLGEAK